MPEEDELVWRRVVLGAGTCGSESPVNEPSVESAEHYPKASRLDFYFFDVVRLSRDNVENEKVSLAAVILRTRQMALNEE